MNTGVYLEFDGCDGSGHTTQIVRLYEALSKRGVRITQQPTAGPAGRLVRDALAGKWPLKDPRTLQLLFAADRQEHSADVRRYVAEGAIVLCDRGALSTWAYGLAMARAAGEPHAEAIGRWADVLSDFAVQPAAILVIDTPIEECLRRLAARGARDLTEREAVLRHVHAIYRDEAAGSRLGRLVRRVDGSGTEAEVAARVLDVVRPLLPTETL